MSQDRKAVFKLPPAVRRESPVPQEVRRNKALEEQKRRRAQQVESNRQLDLFSHLSINDDTDSDDGIVDATPSAIASAALGPYVSMLNDAAYEPQVAEQSTRDMELRDSMESPVQVTVAEPTSSGTSGPAKTKAKKRKKRKNNYNKPSKWADQCMYAELLEMATAHPPWSSDSPESEQEDSLPSDLESGWVAVAPVPVGKRCLVVTHQAAGTAGTSANTTVRSRLLGKSLIPRFPSPLPPLTVLDCILDAHWRDNGIVHVLDVVRWKGQDIGDCEPSFRFWWRDTRLGELPRTLPPNINFFANSFKSENMNAGDQHQATAPKFPYPTYFLPIPYHASTSLASLVTEVIPSARSSRSVMIEVPTPKPLPLYNPPSASNGGNPFPSTIPPSAPFTFTNMISPAITMTPSTAIIEPDGLLLYVAAASYEPGTSPLSVWVPIIGYDTPESMEDQSHQRPLELFEQLVRKRLHRTQQVGSISSGVQDVTMDVETTV